MLDKIKTCSVTLNNKFVDICALSSQLSTFILLRSPTATLNLYCNKVSKYSAGENEWRRACHWRCNPILCTRRRLTAVVSRQEWAELAHLPTRRNSISDRNQLLPSRRTKCGVWRAETELAWDPVTDGRSVGPTDWADRWTLLASPRPAPMRRTPSPTRLQPSRAHYRCSQIRNELSASPNSLLISRRRARLIHRPTRPCRSRSASSGDGASEKSWMSQITDVTSLNMYTGNSSAQQQRRRRILFRKQRRRGRRRRDVTRLMNNELTTSLDQHGTPRHSQTDGRTDGLLDGLSRWAVSHAGKWNVAVPRGHEPAPRQLDTALSGLLSATH